MTCDEADSRLTALVDGELPPADADRVEDHLRHCAACSQARSALARVGRLADAWYVEGGDVWEDIRQEIVAPDLTDLLDAMRSLQGDIQALRTEVADLRRQVAARPSSPANGSGPLFPYSSPVKVTRPLA